MLGDCAAQEVCGNMMKLHWYLMFRTCSRDSGELRVAARVLLRCSVKVFFSMLLGFWGFVLALIKRAHSEFLDMSLCEETLRAYRLNTNSAYA